LLVALHSYDELQNTIGHATPVQSNVLCSRLIVRIPSYILPHTYIIPSPLPPYHIIVPSPHQPNPKTINASPPSLRRSNPIHSPPSSPSLDSIPLLSLLTNITAYLTPLCILHCTHPDPSHPKSEARPPPNQRHALLPCARPDDPTLTQSPSSPAQRENSAPGRVGAYRRRHSVRIADNYACGGVCGWLAEVLFRTD
jgi:hypothetical protein